MFSYYTVRFAEVDKNSIRLFWKCNTCMRLANGLYLVLTHLYARNLNFMTMIVWRYKMWSILYAMVQGKVNTYWKVKRKYCKKGVVSCKTMRKLFWLNIWNSSSEMLRNIVILKFLERYWRQTPSKVFSREYSEITQNFYPSCGTNVINCL